MGCDCLRVSVSILTREPAPMARVATLCDPGAFNVFNQPSGQSSEEA